MTSKLQIRAQVLDFIEKLDLDALNDESQQELVSQIKQIEPRDFLLQTLIKELNTRDDVVLQKVAYYLLEINDFNGVKERLWHYIKDPIVSDRVKEICCTLLRAFGERITPEDLIDYLENPIELIDAETKKLLDIALVNPEVQIDFLDFLFALGEPERESLVRSLNDDYQGDSLVNILAPILDATDDAGLKEEIIKVLGDTQCYSAVLPLQNVVNFSLNEKLEKAADISLKKLRIAGISPEDEKVYAHDSILCQKSKPYKCFVSEVDGMGNQGVIVSRIDEEDKVQMFCTVISDVEGIVDCFGFYALSQLEFDKIVKSFDQDAIKIFVAPEYAKSRLISAENISRKAQKKLPYEYIAWRALIFDFVKMPSNLSYMVLDWAIADAKIDYKLILNSDIFKLWFFDEEDMEVVDEFLDEILIEDFSVEDSLDDKIDILCDTVFDRQLIDLYFDRLCHTAYLYNILEEELVRNNIATLAKEISELESASECKFFTWVLRKTVFEAFLREKELNNEVQSVESSPFMKKTELVNSIFSDEKLDGIIDALRKRWEY